MTSPPQKACPVVLRRNNGTTEILAFRHPLAGHQLVKGTIEAGEDFGHAALRELREESEICDARIDGFIGSIAMTAPDQQWHLFLCSTGQLPDQWTHFTLDDGGHEFHFFWHPLQEPVGEAWHPAFGQAIEFIRRWIMN